MATNSRFVTTKTLEPLFVNRTTGEPLANGTVTFYKDNDRLTLKDVYQLAGSPPNYTFATLPNPITLNVNGTFSSDGANNVALYYLPYTSENSDETELYYVVVKDEDGNTQFTREGWPSFDEASSDDVAEGTVINEISNSQFVDINFVSPLSVDYTGAATTTIPIAPDWNLEVTHDDAGTITVTRNAIAGSSNIDTNPAYTLTITPGDNITLLKLVQRLSENSDIWVPKEADVGGFVNGGVLLGDGTSVTMNYVPSNGTLQQIMDVTNSEGELAYLNNTVEFVPGDNSDSGEDAYVDIELILSNGSSSTISSVQLVGLTSDVATVSYRQDTVNRQKDYLSHYYDPLLAAKPVPNLLDAWDFPLNPAQLFTSTVAASAIGANKSKYVWDQTIIFQSANSGVGVTRATDGGLVLTAAATTQMALIQYQDQTKARMILNNRLAVNVRVATSAVQNFTVSLWATTDASLPDVNPGTNNSLVATLDANGKPATFNGSWTEIARSNLGDATFETDNTDTYANFGFFGWENTALSATATFFAIVVGTDSVTSTETVTFSSVNLVQGDIPCIPAAQSQVEVLNDCQRYYEKSFELATTAATAVAAGAVNFSTMTGINTSQAVGVSFKTRKRSTSYNLTTFNPAAANAEIRNFTQSSNFSSTAVGAKYTSNFYITSTSPNPNNAGDRCAFQWEADNRLGITA